MTFPVQELENLLVKKLFKLPTGVWLKALTIHIEVNQLPTVEIQRVQTGAELEVFPTETYAYAGEPLALERLPSLSQRDLK